MVLPALGWQTVRSVEDVLEGPKQLLQHGTRVGDGTGHGSTTQAIPVVGTTIEPERIERAAKYQTMGPSVRSQWTPRTRSNAPRSSAKQLMMKCSSWMETSAAVQTLGLHTRSPLATKTERPSRGVMGRPRC